MGWVLFSTAQVREWREGNCFSFFFQPDARRKRRGLTDRPLARSLSFQVLLTSVTLGVLQKNGIIR